MLFEPNVSGFGDSRDSAELLNAQISLILKQHWKYQGSAPLRNTLLIVGYLLQRFIPHRICMHIAPWQVFKGIKDGWKFLFKFQNNSLFFFLFADLSIIECCIAGIPFYLRIFLNEFQPAFSRRKRFSERSFFCIKRDFFFNCTSNNSGWNNYGIYGREYICLYVFLCNILGWNDRAARAIFNLGSVSRVKVRIRIPPPCRRFLCRPYLYPVEIGVKEANSHHADGIFNDVKPKNFAPQFLLSSTWYLQQVHWNCKPNPTKSRLNFIFPSFSNAPKLHLFVYRNKSTFFLISSFFNQ